MGHCPISADTRISKTVDNSQALTALPLGLPINHHFDGDNLPLDDTKLEKPQFQEIKTIEEQYTN